MPGITTITIEDISLFKIKAYPGVIDYDTGSLNNRSVDFYHDGIECNFLIKCADCEFVESETGLKMLRIYLTMQDEKIFTDICNKLSMSFEKKIKLLVNSKTENCQTLLCSLSKMVIKDNKCVKNYNGMVTADVVLGAKFRLIEYSNEYRIFPVINEFEVING
jgi:hypothetical protein